MEEKGNKRLRVSSTYNHDLMDKLDKLSCACGISPTTLQTELIKLCLENESMVNLFQDRYKQKARFRVIPVRVDGELKYVFAEKKSLNEFIKG